MMLPGRIIQKLLLGMILLGLTPNPVSAGEHSTKRMTKKIQLQGERHLTVKMDIGGAVIDLKRGKDGDLVNAEVEYDPDEIQVEINYHRFGEQGRLYLKSRSREDGGLDLDREDNYWYLEFSQQIPISFEIDVGACEANLDFTGLKITGLEMDVGASSVEVDFRKPNPGRISRINIDAGASKLSLTGLGNANFDRLTLDGGVGDFVLDFSGEFEHTSYVDIDIGVGSLTLLVPEDAGVQINTETSFLSSFSMDMEGMEEMERGVYQTRNWGRTEKELVFNIEAGLGSVKIKYMEGSL